MPLYQCEQCGWATTAFRVEAVRDHHDDCPECLGTIRMVFYVGTPSVDPDPPLAELQAERDRARERLSRRRVPERTQRPGRMPALRRSAIHSAPRSRPSRQSP
jgi:hypothetical protein